MNEVEIAVRSGEVIAQRLFDVCYSIELGEVERLWTKQIGGATSRGRLIHTPTKAVAFDVPPVAIKLEPVELAIGPRVVTAQATARCYDFGVVALALQVEVKEAAWADFVTLFNAVDKAIGPNAPETIWEVLLEKVLTPLTPAMIKPTATRLQEDNLLAVVRRWSEPIKGADLLERVDLAPLLSGESRPLAEAARKDLLKQRFSYYEDDLVVLTWDRAFVYEPRGDSDVCDILEVANAQLLEFRYYDELLDGELPRMYDLVEEMRRTSGLLSSRRFARLARRLYTLVAEVTELTERVDNALHVTEDVYLARIYMSALDSYRVPIFSSAVDKKLAIVRDTYTALFDEASGARGEILEIAVVILIVIEVVLAILRHG